jgi:hypothetical protein
MSLSKKFTYKGTYFAAGVLSVGGLLPSYDLILPPLRTVYVYLGCSDFDFFSHFEV